jgi:hypothetical protein
MVPDITSSPSPQDAPQSISKTGNVKSFFGGGMGGSSETCLTLARDARYRERVTNQHWRVYAVELEALKLLIVVRETGETLVVPRKISPCASRL